MQAKLAELEMIKAAPEKKEEAKPGAAATVPRDSTIKLINMDKTKGKEDGEENEIREMLMCCTLGELVTSDKDENSLEKFLEKGTTMRCEDEKGEMPLHKLARVKVTDSNKMNFKKSFSSMIKLMREQAGKAGKKSIVTDVNHQDKAGKTPLFMAVEHKNLELIELLFTLKVDGPDSILVNSVGWTVSHSMGGRERREAGEIAKGVTEEAEGSRHPISRLLTLARVLSLCPGDARGGEYG